MTARTSLSFLNSRFCTLVLWIVAGVAISYSQPAVAETTPWTPDDVILAERLGATAIADDGQVAVWVQNAVAKRKDKHQHLGHIWMARFDKNGLDKNGEPVQLTHGRERISGIALSPDARHLAFVSDRPASGGDKDKDKAASQLWVLALTGGEARAVTSGSRSVGDFAWIDDQSLLISRDEQPSLHEQTLETEQDTSIAVDDIRGHPYSRLFRVGLDGEAQALTWDKDWISQLAVAPTGDRAVVSAQQSTRFSFDAKIPARVFLVDLKSGKRNEILVDSGLQPHTFRWAADSAPGSQGEGFYFIDDFTNHPIYRQATVAHLYFYDLATAKARRVEHDWQRGLGGGYHPVPGGVVALLADGTRYMPSRIRHTDAQRSDLAAPKNHRFHIDSWIVARDGSRVLYTSSSSERSPQLFVADLTADGWQESRQLSKLNTAFSRRPSGKTEVVRWRGALDDQVEGVLHYPYGWKAGQKYPLILDIHGGPTGYDRDSWRVSWGSPTPLWRQRGAFVFRVNYHGSGNYGLDWAESIRERYYELEIPDIELGVDMLIEKGLVDSDRLATTGWSNGGILSAGLIVQTERYKAAIVGAADVEWISDWANVDFGAAFDNYYFGGPPWERLDHYVEKSPFFQVEKITTPTLLHTGTEDRNVPPHQSWSMFRAIQFLEKADTRLLLYPGEPHGLRQIPHQKRKLAEDLEWMDKHLFKSASLSPSPIPQGSLLASRLALRDASRDASGRWGHELDGRLIPETVPFGESHIGRFEVTMDQWRAFAPEFLPVLDGELPATGMSFEEASAYVKWLSSVTAETFRLPTVKEAAAFRQKGQTADDEGAKGVTLDRLIGNAPNADDRDAILKAVDREAISLLEPVGSQAGMTAATGGPYVFDLDGNAAEWAVAEDSSGKPVGNSADRAAGSLLQPTDAYIGLRVVRDTEP